MTEPRPYLRLVSSIEPREALRQMALIFAGLDAEARGADVEPVADVDLAVDLERLARKLRASGRGIG